MIRWLTTCSKLIPRMALAAVLSVASVSLLFVFGGRMLYEQYYGEQNCEMTYMYLYPQYQVETYQSQSMRIII